MSELERIESDYRQGLWAGAFLLAFAMIVFGLPLPAKIISPPPCIIHQPM